MDWIPSKDALPAEKKLVFFTDGDSYDVGFIEDGNWKGQGLCWINDPEDPENFLPPPTHWMFIPELTE